MLFQKAILLYSAILNGTTKNAVSLSDLENSDGLDGMSNGIEVESKLTNFMVYFFSHCVKCALCSVAALC